MGALSRLRTPGIACATLVVLLTAAGVAQGRAPAFGECIKQEAVEGLYHGGFTDSKCLSASPEETGKYKGYTGVQEPAFAISGTKATFETVAGAKMTCTASTGHGAFAGAGQASNLVVKWTGCTSLEGACTSPEQESGHVTTTALKATLGWINEGEGKAALEVYTERNVPFLQAKCGATAVIVRGSVLAPLKLGKPKATNAIKFKAKKGGQEPGSLQGGPAVGLEASFGGEPYEAAGLKAKLNAIAPKPFDVHKYDITAYPWFVEPFFRGSVNEGGAVLYDNDRHTPEIAGELYTTIGGGPQEFIAGGGKVVCPTTSGEGTASGLQEASAALTVHLEGCEAQLPLPLPSGAANVAPTEYVYYADGRLAFPHGIEIKIPGVPGGCKLQIPAQTIASTTTTFGDQKGTEHWTELDVRDEGALEYEWEGTNCSSLDEAAPPGNTHGSALLPDGFDEGGSGGVMGWFG
jgi:hypothetical protein